MCELHRDAVLFQNHQHSLTQLGGCIFSSLSMAVRAATAAEPGVREPDTVLALLNAIRDINRCHWPSVGQLGLTAHTWPAPRGEVHWAAITKQ